MNQIKLGIVFAVFALATSYYVSRSTSREVTMLFLGGVVNTLDGNNTHAEAVAVSGNYIVGVGSNEEIRAKFKSDNIVDLEGKTVMPGLVDGHCHILGEGSKLQNIDFVGTTSAVQVAELVAKRAAETEPGKWIYGRGWDQNDWEIKNFPTSELLDRASPNNPVYLIRVDGHAIWVNSKAMELAKVGAETGDPDGGKVYRDASGKPTGVFVDNAKDLISAVVPSLTDQDVEDRIRLALNECAKLGLTEVHDMGVDLQTIGAYKRLIESGNCPVRVYAAIGGPGETWNSYLKTGKEVGFGNGMLTVRTMKLYMDGALGSRGAALLEEYNDDPGNRGLTVTSEADLEHVCRQAAENGFQVCTHAIGDRGNDIVLNVYEKVLKSSTANPAAQRWRIEHAQVLTLPDIPRFAKIGIIPSMQPTHATSDMYWAEARLGHERIKGAYAWRLLMQAGSMIVGGSDFPVEGVNPLWGYYAAVTRSDQTGYPQDGWYSSQKMTREEAARCFTQWAAYGAFEEHVKGSIEPGKWADLTILSKDIMTIPPKEILSTEVEMTIVGGKVVYRKAASGQ